MTDMDDILNAACEKAGLRLPKAWSLPKKPRGDRWFARVEKMLWQGYGVEDIAIRLRCEIEDVRRHVATLRKSARLAKMFGGRS